MKRTSSLLFYALNACAFVIAFTGGSAVFGDPVKPHQIWVKRPVHAAPGNATISNGAGTTPLPQWNYSVTAGADLGGATYTGQIVGRSPYSNGKTTTTIPTQIIPLVITINDGTTTVTYDPTTNDGCLTGTPTDVSVITGSPIFTNNSWTMNGVNVGNTQYIDAFQRAEFWTLVQGSDYHLILNPTVLPKVSISFTGSGTNGGKNYVASQFGGCGNIGVVQNQDLDNAVVALLQGSLAASVNVGTFPIFLIKNVVSTDSGLDINSNCCILGYHSAFTVGTNLQIYSPFSLDSSGLFGGDVSTLAHEMGEAINDPSGNNPTPTWGNIGQQPNAQNNFEVGDPLSNPSGSFVPKDFVVTGSNGFTYHLQELAFFSWFYGGTSLGTGGKFSNNGTFGGDMILYPPGGSH